MDTGCFCEFAARENIRLRWRARVNRAGTRYRVLLSVKCAEHVCHEWSDVFPIDRPLPDALAFVTGKYAAFYGDLIEKQRDTGRHGG